MQFNHKYKGQSSVSSSGSEVGISFAPDTLREPTYFVGDLHDKLNFREAISALHYVVVADFKFKPSNKDDYKNWLKDQEKLWLAEAMSGTDDLERRIKQARLELETVRKSGRELTKPFYKAQKEYFNYLYKRDYAAWYVLDPVITVHPDQVFFECFSQDESVYGKLSCSHNVFKNINEFKCGTTNIDYSKALFIEFQKLRTYKETKFTIDPSGFDVQTGNEDAYREVKIDLPDSWMRGFLQVSSAMIMDQVSFDLHPADIANFIFVLKRNKERHGPRSIKYILKPGYPVEAIFEPWNHKVVCPQSIYKGDKPREIRVWGRRRLLLLERLLPVSKKFTVKLLGSGLPSFYIADLGQMDFTLGLSGWSANDWTSSSRLNLLNVGGNVDSKIMSEIYQHVRKKWFSTDAAIAKELNHSISDVKLALSKFTQAGKMIFDLTNGVYRVRELKKEGVDIEELRFSNETEKLGFELFDKNQMKLASKDELDEKVLLKGTTENGVKTELELNMDQKIIGGKCSCSYYYTNQLKKGPCEHMIALRLSADN
ncbi:MAG: SWIM zinc finger family protein [Flavobacteriales bacterium]